MNIVALLLGLMGSLIVFGLAYLLLKGTILDVRSLRENPWPFLWYWQVLLILVPLIVVSYTSIDNVPVLFMAQAGLETPVAAAVIVSLLIYILSLAIFLRVFRLDQQRVLAPFLLTTRRSYKRLAELAGFLSVFGLMLLVAFYFLGYKHAFLFSMLRGVSLLAVRLQNNYSSSVPSQLASVLPLVGYFLAVVAGYMKRYSKSTSLRYLVISLFILTAPGDKAPGVHGFLLWLFAAGTLLPRSLLSIQGARFGVIVLVTCLALTWFVVSRQVSDMTVERFARYLLGRLGVGQMAGVYETAALIQAGYPMQDEFKLHMIPFASLIADYTDYQKHLMMVSEGVSYSQMGVKNTYFLAEAYAIGGPLLAILSPVIVAFSTSLGLLLLVILLRLFFGREMGVVALPLYLRTHNITGGFSHFPFLKGWFLLALQLGLLWVIWLLWRGFFSISRNRERTVDLNWGKHP